MSARQGDMLAQLIAESNIPLNSAWDGGPVRREENELPRIHLPGGAHLTILSPGPAELQRLAELWHKERGKWNIDLDEAPERSAPEKKRATKRESVEKKAPTRKKQTKRRETLLSDDVEELAHAPFQTDTSVANASSIAFLFEHAGRSTLVTGDATAEVLVESIHLLLGEQASERLLLDAFVVPHCGSRRNLSRELLELVACDRFLISTDGSKFRQPDRETIARIITFGRFGPNGYPTLIFNYRSHWNDDWDDPKLQSRYKYKAIYPVDDAEGIRVVL